jgi:type IV secretory pathway VirB10-like protein
MLFAIAYLIGKRWASPGGSNPGSPGLPAVRCTRLRSPYEGQHSRTKKRKNTSIEEKFISSPHPHELSTPAMSTLACIPPAPAEPQPAPLEPPPALANPPPCRQHRRRSHAAQPSWTCSFAARLAGALAAWRRRPVCSNRCRSRRHPCSMTPACL